MKYGFVLPYGDARTAAELAHEAEVAGWDGFFVKQVQHGGSKGCGMRSTNSIRGAQFVDVFSRDHRAWCNSKGNMHELRN